MIFAKSASRNRPSRGIAVKCLYQRKLFRDFKVNYLFLIVRSITPIFEWPQKAARTLFKIGLLSSIAILPLPHLLILLLMSGYVHPNPRSIFPCLMSAGNVTWRKRSMQCCTCFKWVHLNVFPLLLVSSNPCLVLIPEAAGPAASRLLLKILSPPKLRYLPRGPSSTYNSTVHSLQPLLPMQLFPFSFTYKTCPVTNLFFLSTFLHFRIFHAFFLC